MKYTRKAIRQIIQDNLQQVLTTLELAVVSRKSEKAIVQASKDLSTIQGRLKEERQSNKETIARQKGQTKRQVTVPIRGLHCD